jgi:hypothetical protein
VGYFLSITFKVLVLQLNIEIWCMVQLFMTNHTIAFFSSKLPCVPISIVMAAWLGVLSSCAPKEKSTDADAQATDT